jgi:hypothetical protein
MLEIADLQDFVSVRMPEFHFSRFEQCFPSDADAWLQRGFTTAWTAGGSNPGVAIFAVDPAATTFSEADVVAGCHHPTDHLIALGTGGPDDIAGFVEPPPGKVWFIDVSGWAPAGSATTVDYTQGSMDRAAQFAAPLSHALNPGAVMATAGDIMVAGSLTQDTNPRIYVEVDWAGAMPRLDHANGTGDFAPGGTPSSPTFRTDFDNLLVVTYYLFYPFTEVDLSTETTGGTSGRNREGQWEAVSLYFTGLADTSTLDAAGRPQFPFPNMPPDQAAEDPPLPLFAAYSQGTFIDDPTLSDARKLEPPDPAFPVEFGGTDGGDTVTPGSLRVFVSAGTHKNLYTTDEHLTTTTGPPDAGDAALASTLGSIGGGVLGACGATGPLAGFACGLGAMLLALAALFSGLSVANEPSTTTDTEVPSGPTNDLTGSDGAFVYVVGSTPPVLKVINRFAGPAAGAHGEDFSAPPW